MKKIAYYVVPVLLCLIAGLVAGRLQAESVAVWYPLLAKPALTPPDIAFPIAWGIIYLCMGLSLGRVLRYGDKRYVTLWFLQLAVNFLWSVFFFYLRSPLAGFVDILLLDALVIVYICRVRHPDSFGGVAFCTLRAVDPLRDLPQRIYPREESG